MRFIVILSVATAFLSTLVNAQARSPKYSAADFLRAAQAAPCDNRETRGPDGLCPPSVLPDRGFNLGAHLLRRHRQSATSASSLANLNITFHEGSAKMTENGETQARVFAAALQLPAMSKRRFEIAGHTDAKGPARQNVKLSQERANTVVDYLVSQGVDRSRLMATGYGSQMLAVPNAPLDPANRRVEALSLN
jgi:outer membrane protein OmpA-like peptidoglycan-associated protein